MASETSSSESLVVIGASYASGWPVESIGGLPVINKGVGGQEIRPVLVTEITMAKSPGPVNALRYWFDGLRGKASYAERVNRHVTAMNAWIREHAAVNDIPVLDFERVFADAVGWRRPAFAAEDGSHVTPEGHAALSAYVEEQWLAFVAPQ